MKRVHWLTRVQTDSGEEISASCPSQYRITRNLTTDPDAVTCQNCLAQMVYRRERGEDPWAATAQG